jgi:cobalt-zinc-cadmium efflux system outer membrane protein
LGLLCVVSWTVSVRSHASERGSTHASLTEAQAVERALRHPALADLRTGWVGEARADGLERTTWTNPSLSYTREQLFGDETLGEDFVTLSQTLDISGRKSVARDAASERERAAGHRADAVVVEITAEVRRRYYRLLLAQERERVLEQWRKRVATRLAAVVKREQAGDAAAYDRLRLQQELTGVGARLERERAARSKAWTLLRALVDPEKRAVDRADANTMPKLDGRILPTRAHEAQATVEATSNAPEAKARAAEARALALDRRASSRWWVPNPSLGAGYKGAELPEGGRAHGFMVTLGLPLPMLDRQRAERTRAEAQSRSLRAETSLRATEARAQAAGLAQEVAMLSNGARAMMRDAARQSEELIRAAESGYQGGEIGVIDLVDAYRSATEADLTALDLAMRARNAEVELRRLTEAPS